MNLQPLYDLKERLEYAAIAGTGLMQEDFRLRRAVEAMTPLAGVNPVFAKIAAAAKALLNAPKEARSKALLDVLSLVDAVVYTQGVANISGDLEPMAPGSGTYVEVSYGTFQPLLTALSGSGSGRLSVIRDCFSEHPEYFGDYRILPHAVNALGDNYADVAELMIQILLAQGQAVIPALKAGFDPAGKKEMARRVYLIARLAGGQENDWFIAMLPDSKREVREALIQALSLSQKNSRVLMDLFQSERGKMKEAALRSLAMMKDPDCMELLRKEIGKKPENAALFKGVDSAIAADLVAEAVQLRLSQSIESLNSLNEKKWTSLNNLIYSMAGKCSAQMEACWRWIASYKDQNGFGFDSLLVMQLQKMLMHTVLWNPKPEVLAMARSLAADYRTWFLGSGFLADLMELPPEELYERYGPMIVRTNHQRQETEAERNDRIQIMSVLYAVLWDSNYRSYVISYKQYDSLTCGQVESVWMIRGLDTGWLRLLMDPEVSDDGYIAELSHIEDPEYRSRRKFEFIRRLIDEDNPEVCELAGTWYYHRIWNSCSSMLELHSLLRCGWKNWKGLLIQCVIKQRKFYYDHLMEWIQRVPLSNAEKAEELRQIDLLVRQGKIAAMYDYWPVDEIFSYVATLEADPD